MGQATRQPKYSRVWGQVNDTWESSRRLIEKMLLILSDEQLDQLLSEIERDERCETCQVPDHDVCSMTDGCPCCEDTKQQVHAVNQLPFLGEKS